MSKPEILAFHRPQQEISPRGFGFMEYAIISDILKRGFVTDESFLTIKIQMNIV
jgi:TNF receptor-associated factor 6